MGLQSYEYDDRSTDSAGLLFDLFSRPEATYDRYSPEVLEDAAELLRAGDYNLDTIEWSFSYKAFEDWLRRNGKRWERTKSGRLKTDADTFRIKERSDANIAPLRQLLSTLGEMRLFENLAIGDNGRNRTLISQFRSITGRNQPSPKYFVFGGAAWVRHFIAPPEGHVLMYVDWSAQEFAIQAFFSGNDAMIQDYRSGDPYLGFGKRAGVVPPDATKETHPKIRDALKIATGLGAAYGG